MLSGANTLSTASRRCGGQTVRPVSLQAASLKPSGTVHDSSSNRQSFTSSSNREQNGASSRRQILGVGFLSTIGLLSSKPAFAAGGTLGDLLQPMKRELDPNSDGFMDVEELRAAVSAALEERVPLDVIRTGVIPTVDFDEDGKVSTDEFLRALSLDLPIDEATWAVIDKNVDGVATLTEMRTALGNIGGQGGDSILEVAFENADKGSHQLSPEQASTFMDWVATGVLGDMADF